MARVSFVLFSFQKFEFDSFYPNTRMRTASSSHQTTHMPSVDLSQFHNVECLLQSAHYWVSWYKQDVFGSISLNYSHVLSQSVDTHFESSVLVSFSLRFLFLKVLVAA